MKISIYRFQWFYVLLIAGGYTIAFCTALFSRPFPGITSIFFIANILFIAALFSVLKFGIYCEIDEDSFTRVSYFFVEKKIPIDQIEEISFRSTYSFGGSGSLWVAGYTLGRKLSIQMTEMAYGRRAIIDAVKTLREKNNRIKLGSGTDVLFKK